MKSYPKGKSERSDGDIWYCDSLFTISLMPEEEIGEGQGRKNETLNVKCSKWNVCVLR